VKDYMGVLAADEARGDFMPQDYSRLQVLDRSKTTVAFLTFPGVHNTVVVEKDSALPEVTSMVRYLAYRFLSDRGTAFKAPENVYSTIRACQVYAQMQKKRASYAALMKKTFVAKQSGGIVQRSTVQLSNSIHPIFVNEHHRLVFKAAFPDIYNWFFTTLVPNPLGKVTTSFRASDPWGQKFQMFYQTDPDSFGLFEDAFTVERRASGGMPAVWTVSAPGVSSAALPVAAQAGLPLVTSLV
jgi:hypothetical protein